MLVSVVSFLEPCRAIGIWTQVPWMLSLLISVYFFARLELKASPWLAVALALPVASIRAIYYFNGGLSDYRMDLHLYLLYGCSLIWFIIALRQENYFYCLICGVFSSLAALSRGTAPVYLLVTMAPIFVVHFAMNIANTRKIMFLVKGMLIWIACFVVLALWFYLYNLTYLHYYYFVWNTDANLKLPISESRMHIGYTWASFGWPMFFTLVSALLVSFPYERIPLYQWKHVREYLASLRWEVLFMALVPAGFLVLRGAGPNPYVSMPSALGLVLVFLCLRGSWEKLSVLRTRLVIVVLAAGCLFNAYRGLRIHEKDTTFPHRIAGYNVLISALEKEHVKGKDIRVLSITGGYFTYAVLQNVLCMDRGYTIRNSILQKGDIRYDIEEQYKFVFATKVEWDRQIPGNSDQDRIAFLANVANNEFSYAVLPTDATAEMLRKDQAYHHANGVCLALKQEILKTGKWESMNLTLHISDGESFEVYRNLGETKPPAKVAVR
ncbi:MAG TPA: hypothetical protein VK970_08720 [Candidatus Methylacidiphilales bacterium]|nr:hypothetical protein [Candidatus Methylacidiphilales bacterium]